MTLFDQDDSGVDLKTTQEKKPVRIQEEFETTPLYIALICYLSYAILIMFGHLRDFLRRTGLEKTRSAIEKNREGYVPLYQNFESFYTRNIYRRICHGWNMPICSMPGSIIEVVDRDSDDYNWTFRMTGTTTSAINMGSYNYLGFAENSGPRAESVEEILKKDGVGVSSSRHELGEFWNLYQMKVILIKSNNQGTLGIHRDLEQLVATFLGVEDSIIVGMGFATNSTNIPILAGKGSLIMSDELNHASLILGCRLSGAVIKVFKHNDPKDLEKKIRAAIVEGQPRTHRPWKKVIIFIEGVYSMEGSIVKLPEIIAIKKKYKAYIYLDEAHSIGAVGPNGRGIVDYYNCDPKDIDMLMGYVQKSLEILKLHIISFNRTFTKSFGAAGGYIAGSKALIDHIRVHSHSFSYATSMSPPVAQQIVSVFHTLLGSGGDTEGKF